MTYSSIKKVCGSNMKVLLWPRIFSLYNTQAFSTIIAVPNEVFPCG
jgi:hypothetical protein